MGGTKELDPIRTSSQELVFLEETCKNVTKSKAYLDQDNKTLEGIGAHCNLSRSIAIYTIYLASKVNMKNNDDLWTIC